MERIQLCFFFQKQKKLVSKISRLQIFHILNSKQVAAQIFYKSYIWHGSELNPSLLIQTKLKA